MKPEVKSKEINNTTCKSEGVILTVGYAYVPLVTNEVLSCKPK